MDRAALPTGLSQCERCVHLAVNRGTIVSKFMQVASESILAGHATADGDLMDRCDDGVTTHGSSRQVIT
jgi:hypothetical protein